LNSGLARPNQVDESAGTLTPDVEDTGPIAISHADEPPQQAMGPLVAKVLVRVAVALASGGELDPFSSRRPERLVGGGVGWEAGVGQPTCGPRDKACRSNVKWTDLTPLTITTISDLAPGLIALIYLMRWLIEKAFDTGKNKLQESKGWAVGEVAQEIRAHLFALTHNLLVLIRRHLDVSAEICEEKTVRKRAEALLKRETKAQESGKKVAAIHRLLPAVVQLTVQFIRTIRNGFVLRMRWRAALSPLRISMAAYL
jgi:hypothetical protein